jgi:hypothetical protein
VLILKDQSYKVCFANSFSGSGARRLSSWNNRNQLVHKTKVNYIHNPVKKESACPRIIILVLRNYGLKMIWML